MKQDTREYFPATCLKCGNNCTVPFKPNGKRPIYCQSCYRATQEANGNPPVGPGTAAKGSDESFRYRFYPGGYGNSETFYSTDAQKMVESFDRERMTFTTLRQYYAEVEFLCRMSKTIEKQDDSAWGVVLMRLNLLLAKANFDAGRPSVKIPEAFLPFLRLGISFTKERREVETFKRHFEAVVAYAKTIFKK